MRAELGGEPIPALGEEGREVQGQGGILEEGMLSLDEAGSSREAWLSQAKGKTSSETSEKT